MCVLGRGVQARVELEYVEDGLREKHVGELCDISSQHSIQFITLNPFTYTQRSFTVRNCMYASMFNSNRQFRGYSCSRETRLLEPRSVTYHMGSYLPFRHRWTHLHLSHSRTAGRYSIYPPRRYGRLSCLWCWLYTGACVLRSLVHRQVSISVLTRLGVEQLRWFNTRVTAKRRLQA